MSLNSKQNQTVQTVIDALYDLPLGGDWQELQGALCQFWEVSGTQPSQGDITHLEGHFDRAMRYLDRMPQTYQSWRNELYRLPVPSCVVDESGHIIDANRAGWSFFGVTENTPIELPARSRELLCREIKALSDGDIAAVQLKTAAGTELNLFINRVPQKMNESAPLYFGLVASTGLPEHGFRLLAEKYGLTAREIELALKLAAGKSLEDVLQTSSVKKTTLRSHLASCFSKLGVQSQPELVAFVLHAMFAGSQLDMRTTEAPKLTPHLDPELHGHPKFHKIQLSDGRYLGCLEYGDPEGVPALYTHGSFGSGLFMKSQRLHGNGVRLLAVERGGVGESTPNPNSSPQAYARDILEMADALKLQRFAMIGRSMGSWDAVSVALSAPERVPLLVLAGGRLPVQETVQHQDNPFYTALYRSIWHSNTMGRLMLRMLLIQLRTRGPEHFASREDAVGLEESLARDPMYLRHMKANWLRTAEGGTDPLHNHLKLYRTPLPDPPWVGFATRTVVIHGELDQIVPYERIIEQTASFKNRVVKLLPNVGHRLAQLAMGEVLRTVREEWEEWEAEQR